MLLLLFGLLLLPLVSEEEAESEEDEEGRVEDASTVVESARTRSNYFIQVERKEAHI